MQFRLKENSEFKRLYASGKRSYASGLMMLYSPSKSLKMGISVGKKYGGSVQRNKVKRLVRAAFYEIRNSINKDVNIIFIPKTDFLHTFLNVKKSMLHMLKKEGLI